ncbi:MAG: hypothetical protein ACN6PR_03295 [Achromobacter sp.]
MQKISQSEASDMASDVAVQPLTPAEIQQVSGGHGPNRFLAAVVRTPSSPLSRGAASPGKTIYVG